MSLPDPTPTSPTMYLIIYSGSGGDNGILRWFTNVDDAYALATLMNDNGVGTTEPTRYYVTEARYPATNPGI